MKRNRVTKAAAVACSLALAGAYVGYRIVRANEAAPARVEVPAPPDVAPALREDELMSGSKSLIGVGSGAFADRPRRAAQEEERRRKEEELRKQATFWGSKSAPIFEPPEEPPAPREGKK